MAVKVTLRSGEAKVYESAVSIELNGFADYVFKDDKGRIVATRKRTEDIEDVEVV